MTSQRKSSICALHDRETALHLDARRNMEGDIMRLMMIACSALILLTACGTQVKKVDFAATDSVPETAHPAPFRLSNIVFRLPLGHEIGNYGSQSMNWCVASYEAERTQLTNSVDTASARKAFHQTMSGLGYDVTGSDDFLFEEEADEDWLRTEFKIGAKVINARMDACYQEPGLLGSTLSRRYGEKGELYIEVEWSIYDSLRKTTVYKTVTEGYVDRKNPNYEGLALMFNDAFSMAAHNLAAEQNFRELMIYGRRPDKDLWKAKNDHADARRKFDAQEAVKTSNAPLSVTPLTQHLDTARHVAVMVEGGTGHGSGFFITNDGHILTNSHVVGDALRVRVVSADKDEKMIAEVLRRDPARDVALLKLEDKPKDLKITVLPLRTAWPAIGEDVYAIGAPLARQLQDTVTKGMVSAHRKNFRILGTRQNFIQADIEIHGGNSGGPLLDSRGNIVGLSVAGYTDADAATGLNMFVPVGEALDRLNISYP